MPNDPVIAAWRGVFPSLFKDAAAMPKDLRRHVRYPELFLRMQATGVRALSHDGSGGVLQPRGFVDGGERGGAGTDSGEQGTLPMDPNFVLMKLPEAQGVEFIDILPFTPAKPEQSDWMDCGAERRGALWDSRWCMTFPRRGWWMGRCRWRRGLTRTRS